MPPVSYRVEGLSKEFNDVNKQIASLRKVGSEAIDGLVSKPFAGSYGLLSLLPIPHTSLVTAGRAAGC